MKDKKRQKGSWVEGDQRHENVLGLGVEAGPGKGYKEKNWDSVNIVSSIVNGAVPKLIF